MHALHQYLDKRLLELLNECRVVVFYDPRREFGPFVTVELQETGLGPGGLRWVDIAGAESLLATYEGSFFGLRTQVEPIVAQDRPALLLLYLPGVSRDPTGSVLMELEKAGATYEPRLKQVARQVLLRQGFDDGQIDEMLRPPNLSYDDIVSYLRQSEEAEAPSVLRTIYDGAHGDELLVKWLVDDGRDDMIAEKEATYDLLGMLEHRLGLLLPAEVTPDEARQRALRYILVNEFRSDFAGEAPGVMSMIPSPTTKELRARLHSVAQSLREQYAERYVAIADRVESELLLDTLDLDPTQLGSTDTFRFEERRLLAHVDELVAVHGYHEALSVVEARAQSFWVARDIRRRSQWEVCRLMAELGQRIDAARPQLEKLGPDAMRWVQAYADDGSGWCHIDALHRRLEHWVTSMDEEPQAQQGLDKVRRLYDDLLRQMAEGFSAAFRACGWTVPGILHQTSVYPEAVDAPGGPAAYFLVDALRYEMGVELAKQLEGAEELSIRPAIAALPTITTVGMAALLPAASASFSVIDHKGKVAAQIEGSAMPGFSERSRFWRSRVPSLVDLTLSRLFGLSAGALAGRIRDASLVLVRSPEIDSIGETDSDLLVRQAMDTVIGNLARAVRKLAEAGIERFVIAADHGYQLGLRKDEAMKVDHPGGRELAVHRRCWLGYGGATPPGAVRVTGVELGYDTELDFVYPSGLGVFRASGGLGFHHGGISLQELVIPVLTFRIPSPAPKECGAGQLSLSGVPAAITNRTFGVRVVLAPALFSSEPVPVRVILLAQGEQVGHAGMAIGAEFDRESGVVHLTPGVEANLGLVLIRDDCEALSVVALDPATDAVLSQSDDIPVRLGL
jgi:uncharacterized membrane protein